MKQPLMFGVFSLAIATSWRQCVSSLIYAPLSFVFSWSTSWLSWTRQSEGMLRAVEKQILSYVKTAYKRFYVDIGPVVGQADKIWTIALNEDSTRTPLVLLHGLGAGVALWCLNLDAFAQHRPVYAIDMLGFGRSSRPSFSCDAEKAEQQLVDSVEEWRREVGLQRFILLGHSMGGYIATSYALRYPERVHHLILADPWGFPDRPDNALERRQIPLWVRAAVTTLQPLNPLWALRAAGPAGRWLIEKTRPDLVKKFANHIPEAGSLIPDYIHQCNVQTPSGESAFHAMMHGFGWAKNPMVHRVDRLSPDLAITLLYGSRSWVDNVTGDVLKKQRPASSYTQVQSIIGAGHHVYLDKPEIFNKFVQDACAYNDGPSKPANKMQALPAPDTTEEAEVPSS